jgi:manganese/zinc/iron transport system substrate-binding protein
LKKQYLLPGFILLLAMPLLAACTTVESQVEISERPVRVVATTSIVADTVKNIGGERVEVYSLMGPGVDPHLYKASEGDVIRLATADVIFYNGLHLEAQMGRVFERMQGRVISAAVAEDINTSLLLASPDYENAYDPHIWFDVRLWMIGVETIRDVLAGVDPVHAPVYHENAQEYLSELNNLHEYLMEQTARLPAEKRILITAHDAFTYFGQAYGFEVYGLQGISTASEAGASDVQALAAFIVEQQVPAIFIESSVPTRTIEAVQAAVRARGFSVEIGGELFSDALGTEGTPEGTYIGMVRHNMDTIVEALSQN